MAYYTHNKAPKMRSGRFSVIAIPVALAIVAIVTPGTMKAATISYTATCTITSGTPSPAGEVGNDCLALQGADYNWDVNLPKFNTSLGTLTGVTLYFYFNNQVSQLTITNNSAGAGDFNLDLITDPILSMTNTAHSTDKFVADNFTLFDTGVGTNTALGNCVNSGPTDIPPATCTAISLTGSGAGSSYSIASPYSVNVNDSAYQSDPGIPGSYHWNSGSSVSGLVDTVLPAFFSNYSFAGNSSFDLKGTTATTYSANEVGQSGSANVTVQYTVNTQFAAEVDYTYTPLATPEPATMALMGSALIGLAVVGKKLRRER